MMGLKVYLDLYYWENDKIYILLLHILKEILYLSKNILYLISVVVSKKQEKST